MKKQAEDWLLRQGQCYDPDTHLYPKTVVIDAFLAGFDFALNNIDRITASRAVLHPGLVKNEIS